MRNSSIAHMYDKSQGLREYVLGKRELAPSSEHTQDMEMDLELRVSHDLPPDWLEAAAIALAEVCAWVPHPEAIKFVYTDSPRAFAEYAALSVAPSSSGAADQAEYQLDRADGAMAVALTVPLESRRAVIVFNVGLLGDVNLARRVARHEVRHILLNRREEAAWGIHRRLQAYVPRVPFEYVWIAETAIDEYRCELAVEQRDVASDPSLSNPGFNRTDVAGIEALFLAIRTSFRQSANASAAYHAVVSASERLMVTFAYLAARINARSPDVDALDDIEGLVDLAHLLKGIPNADEEASATALARCIETVASLAFALLRRHGFEIQDRPQGKYLEVL